MAGAANYKSGKDILMTNTRSSKILVAIDIAEEETTKKLISYALRISDPHDEIIVVNVVDVDLNSAMIDRFSDLKASYLNAAKDRVDALLGASVPDTIKSRAVVRSGRTYVEILDAATEFGADMIVVGAHKPTMKDYLLGMTAARVVRHANSSVTVVR